MNLFKVVQRKALKLARNYPAGKTSQKGLQASRATAGNAPSKRRPIDLRRNPDPVVQVCPPRSDADNARRAEWVRRLAQTAELPTVYEHVVHSDGESAPTEDGVNGSHQSAAQTDWLRSGETVLRQQLQRRTQMRQAEERRSHTPAAMHQGPSNELEARRIPGKRTPSVVLPNQTHPSVLASMRRLLESPCSSR